MTASRLLGLGAIALALSYNAAFTWLAGAFDYPDILRLPAEEVLGRFAEGGPGLILGWHAFALTAIAFTALAPGLALSGRRIEGLAVSAALFGALAGLAQAIGLLRWSLSVPGVAALAASDPELAGLGFHLLNTWGGVAIGEALGQHLTAFFLVAMGLIGLRDGARIRAGIALTAAAAILIGAQEGLLISLGRETGLVPLFAVAGYVGLSAWLVAEGAARLGAGWTRRMICAA